MQTFGVDHDDVIWIRAMNPKFFVDFIFWLKAKILLAWRLFSSPSLSYSALIIAHSSSNVHCHYKNFIMKHMVAAISEINWHNCRKKITLPVVAV